MVLAEFEGIQGRVRWTFEVEQVLLFYLHTLTHCSEGKGEEYKNKIKNKIGKLNLLRNTLGQFFFSLWILYIFFRINVWTAF
jgi:hypothetical protein